MKYILPFLFAFSAIACGDMEKNNEYAEPAEGVEELNRLSSDKNKPDEDSRVLEHVEKTEGVEPYGDTISEYKVGVED